MSISETIAPQLEYKLDVPSNPLYKYIQKFQRTGGQTVANAVSASGGALMTFEIDAQLVENLSRTLVRYDIAYSTSANLTTASTLAIFNDTLGELQTVRLYTENGFELAYINYANKYLKSTLRQNTQLRELLAGDDSQLWQGLQTIQQTLSGAGAMTVPNCRVPPISATGAPTVVDKFQNPSYYVTSGATSVTPTLTVSRLFPLGIFEDSFLGIDKDVYFGQRIMLDITIAPFSQQGWLSTNANIGVDAVNVSADNALVQGNIQNLQMFICTEQNPVIQDKVKSAVASGLNILTPFPYVTTVNVLGGNQSVETRLNTGQGKRLRKIYSVPYTTAIPGGATAGVVGGQGILAYNNCNTPTVAPGANLASPFVPSIINNFHTAVNSINTTQFEIYCPQFLDYMLLNEKLKGTCIQSLKDYVYDWFYVDDFTTTGVKRAYDVNDETMLDNQTDGLDLSVEQRYTLTSVVNNPPAGGINWFTVPVVERIVQITPGMTVWS
jgi:hypothetical protein